MKILVDWHDVLQYYTREFLKWYARVKGIELPSDANQKSFAEMGLATMGEDFEAFARTGVLAGLENIEDAQWAIRELSKEYEIILVSASGFALLHEDVLRRNFPELSLVVATTDKMKLADTLNARYVIDDQVRFLKNAPLGCTPIAYKQAWNRDFDGFRGNWQEIVKRILPENRRDWKKVVYELSLCEYQ